MRSNGWKSDPLRQSGGRCRFGRSLSGLLTLVALTCAGCGPGKSIAPVSGKVLLDGQPLSTGRVIAVPRAGRGANGIIQPDGTFQPSTYGDRDGAAIGTHKVAVVAHEGTGDGGPEAGYGKLLVPERYTNPETSELTIEVKADEDNYLELRLTTDAVKK